MAALLAVRRRAGAGVPLQMFLTSRWKFTRRVVHIFTRTPSLVAGWKTARRAASRAASSKPKPALAPMRLGVEHPPRLVDQHLDVHLGGAVEPLAPPAGSGARGWRTSFGAATPGPGCTRSPTWTCCGLAARSGPAAGLAGARRGRRLLLPPAPAGSPRRAGSCGGLRGGRCGRRGGLRRLAGRGRRTAPAASGFSGGRSPARRRACWLSSSCCWSCLMRSSYCPLSFVLHLLAAGLEHLLDLRLDLLRLGPAGAAVSAAGASGASRHDRGLGGRRGRGWRARRDGGLAAGAPEEEIAAGGEGDQGGRGEADPERLLRRRRGCLRHWARVPGRVRLAHAGRLAQVLRPRRPAPRPPLRPAAGRAAARASSRPGSPGSPARSRRGRGCA